MEATDSDSKPNSAEQTPAPQASSGRSVRSVILLVLILIAAVIVRFHGIGTNSLWMDEFFSLKFSCGRGLHEDPLPRDIIVEHLIAPTRLAFAKSIARIPAIMQQDTHPPLYPLTLRVWREIFGEGEVAARSLSAVMSIISVLLLYLTVRLLSGERVALWSAALLAVASSQVEFAHETRSYAMLLTWVLACCWMIALIQVRGSAWRRCALLALFAVLAMLTHYYAAPPLAGAALYGVLRLRGRARGALLTSLLVAAGVWGIIWGRSMWNQRQYFSSNIEWALDSQPDGLAQRRLIDTAQLPAKYLLKARKRDEWMTIPGALIYLLPIFFLRRQPALLLWWLILMFSIGAVLATDLWRGGWMIQMLRFTIVASAAVCALLVALISPPNSRLRHLAPAALVLTTAVSIMPAYDITRQDFRSLGQYLGENMRSDDALVIFERDEPVESDLLYMAVTQYSPQLPARLLVLTKPAGIEQLAHLSWSRQVWIINRSGERAEAMLPGATMVHSEPFPRLATVERVEFGK